MKLNMYQLYAYGAIIFTGISLLAFGFFLLDLPPVSGPGRANSTGPVRAILVNVGLITLFGLQHSLMARKDVKQFLRQWIPEPLERSTYLYASGAALLILVIFWKGMGAIAWDIATPSLRFILYVFFGIGLLMTGWAALSIRGADLSGLRRIRQIVREEKPAEVPFQKPGPYRVVRHPIYLGTLLIFWAQPEMSYGHLLLAVGMTVYVLVGIYFEEKDLLRQYGTEYENYQKEVPSLIPFWPR